MDYNVSAAFLETSILKHTANRFEFDLNHRPILAGVSLRSSVDDQSLVQSRINTEFRAVCLRFCPAGSGFHLQG